MRLLRIIIFPIYPLLYLILRVRNKLYDWNILKSYRSSVRCISIGNLKIGGTGKTPFSNLLIESLKRTNKIALLSRGYGRKSSGYILADSSSMSSDIGDEPKMLSMAHPEVSIAVCENRGNGVDNLLSDLGIIDLIILDDAMQHRGITPYLNIMLTEYDKPYYKDYLFPIGLLRDVRRSARRADIVVVTKSPQQITTQQMDDFTGRIKGITNDKVYFATYDSLPPVSIFTKEKTTLESGKNVVIMSAIASPRKFINNISKSFNVIKTFIFKDHHSYTVQQIEKIADFALKNDAAVVMTPKDSIKVEEMIELLNIHKRILYTQDIQYRILEYRGKNLNSLLNEITKSNINS